MWDPSSAARSAAPTRVGAGQGCGCRGDVWGGVEWVGGFARTQRCARAFSPTLAPPPPPPLRLDYKYTNVFVKNLSEGERMAALAYGSMNSQGGRGGVGEPPLGCTHKGRCSARRAASRPPTHTRTHLPRSPPFLTRCGRRGAACHVCRARHRHLMHHHARRRGPLQGKPRRGGGGGGAGVVVSGVVLRARLGRGERGVWLRGGARTRGRRAPCSLAPTPSCLPTHHLHPHTPHACIHACRALVLSTLKTPTRPPLLWRPSAARTSRVRERGACASRGVPASLPPVHWEPLPRSLTPPTHPLPTRCRQGGVGGARPKEERARGNAAPEV